MDFLYITIIPALFTTLWALITKVQKKSYYDLFLIFACGISLFYSWFIEYTIVRGQNVSAISHRAGLFLSSCIIPFAYMFFANHAKRPIRNTTSTILWLLVPISLLPNVNIFLSEPHTFTENAMNMMMINIIKDGRSCLSLYTSDFVVTMQAIITAMRIIPYEKRMRRYGFRFKKNGIIFISWWLAAIVFSVSFSLMRIDTFIKPVVSWVYFSSYSVLICTIYSLIALDRDFYVKEKKAGTIRSEELRTMIEQNKERAKTMRKIIKEEKVYRIPGYSSEDMIKRLNTNRTYFAKMMNVEFGMNFSKYISQERIKEAMKLMKTTNLSMEEISQKCGFGDVSYMNRKFKEEYGKTARQWINSLYN